MKRIKLLLIKILKFDKCRNIIEALNKSKTLRTISGSEAVGIAIDRKHRVYNTFNLKGYLMMLFELTVYLYCLFKTMEENLSVVKLLYKTKLTYYDTAVLVLSVYACVIYTMNTPMLLQKYAQPLQRAVSSAELIHSIGYIVDHGDIAFTLAFQSCAGLFVVLNSFAVTFLFRKYIPVEFNILVTGIDCTLLATALYYITYLNVSKKLYEIVNNILKDISEKNDLIFFPSRSVLLNPSQLVRRRQQAIICDKINVCTKVYTHLYEISKIGNVFGPPILLLLVNGLAITILNLFYLVEATTAGLDEQNPVAFGVLCLHLIWRMVLSLGISVILVSYSEAVMKEADETPNICHRIINENFSPWISTLALRASRQMHRQQPELKAAGLVKLNYELLATESQVIVTYLALLLQCYI